MSGIVRQASGELCKSKSKGKKFLAELGSAMSPEALSKGKPVTQPIKK